MSSSRLTGKVHVVLPDTPGLQPFIRKALARDGQTCGLRQNCIVADAVKIAFPLAGYDLLPSIPPQFGVNRDGRDFLMVKLATGEKVTWYGKDIPKVAKQRAISHDAGRSVRSAEFDLDFDKAVIVKPKPKRSPPQAPRSAISSPGTPATGRRPITPDPFSSGGTATLSREPAPATPVAGSSSTSAITTTRSTTSRSVQAPKPKPAPRKFRRITRAS